jgi:2-polyprenyl-3-methyl-5-hydroxy-6-metoxy-1,4-benzoquinol methylase
MRDFPKPDIYEQFFKLTPWGISINEVVSVIQKQADQYATVLDLMCGTGYLLNEIHKKRNDLLLEGIDLNEVFIKYAKENYSFPSFHVADATRWNSEKKYDIVLCTGGLHHLSIEEKNSFLKKISKLTHSKGMVIFADPYLDDYTTELERKQAAAKLGYEYLKSTIANYANNDLIKSTIDILYNDVLELEFKTSIKKIEPLLRKYFASIEVKKTWQNNESDFGDYYIICRNLEQPII